MEFTSSVEEGLIPAWGVCTRFETQLLRAVRQDRLDDLRDGYIYYKKIASRNYLDAGHDDFDDANDDDDDDAEDTKVEEVSAKAIFASSTHVGQEVRSLGCLQFLCEHDYLECTPNAGSMCLQGIAKHGSPAMFEYLLMQRHSLGAELRSDANLTRFAALAGNLVCLRYLRDEIGCPCDRDACLFTAMVNCRVDVIRYLVLECACAVTEYMFFQAVSDRKLPALKALHECSGSDSWTPSMCALAAMNGAIECLKYLRAHGCPWDERTTAGAANSGHLECFLYAREQGCPCHPALQEGSFNRPYELMRAGAIARGVFQEDDEDNDSFDEDNEWMCV